MMELSRLIKTTRNKKRVGRGTGSGSGKTSGRGTKGQKSRSGYNMKKGFEGGQTTLFGRLPKTNINSYSKKKPTVILNFDDINLHFSDGDKINAQSVYRKKLSKEINTNIKILARGELKKKVVFSECKLSKKASNKIKDYQK